MLLLEGKTGNTVLNVEGEKIYYQPTGDAIKRREVNLQEVTLFESLGICFGRETQKFKYEFIEEKEAIKRYM